MRVVRAGEVALAVRDWGDAASPPLLCWHGAGEHSRSFEQAARVWADEDGLRVIAPDAPGHGQSPPLPDGSYLPSRLAGVAAGLLDALGIESAVWCGFSWGALIGCRFASAFPRRARALVLVEGGVVDFRDDPAAKEPAPDDPSLGAQLERGMRAEPTADVYDAIAALPVLLVTSAREVWLRSLGFDPVERLRGHVDGLDVAEVEAQHGHDLLGHDARNLARTVGDWLSARDLL